MIFPIDRRKFLVLAGTALAAPQAVLAQRTKRVFRVATLDDAVEGARAHTWQLFRNRLRELLLRDRNDVAYEARYARGDVKALPALASELAALKPDVVACAGTPTTIAMMKVTTSLPIVFIAAGDPVGTGLVASLARPGGNVTGTSLLSTELTGKAFELLRELTPGVKRYAFLVHAENKASQVQFRQLRGDAQKLKRAIQMLDARDEAALEKSFATMKREKVQGLLVGIAGTLLQHRDRIVQFANREKLAAVYGRPEYVKAGGLLSLGADVEFGYLRSAEYAHRVLNGARPADLPVDQVSKTRVALNLKTARSLGIKIPDAIRLRADEVIE